MQKLKYVIGSDQRPLVPDIQNFSIDFAEAGIKNWVQARQYESSMRQVFLDIVNEDGSPFDLTGCNIWFEGLTPDEHRVIFDRQYVPIDPTAGQARIDFLAPAFAVSGSYKQAFFRIYKDGNNISTLEFKFSVLADKVISGIVSADYIQPFEDLYGKLTTILDNADGDLKAKLATWTTKFTDLMTSLSKQGTDTSNMLANVQTALETLKVQITDQGLVKTSDIDNLISGNKIISDLKLALSDLDKSTETQINDLQNNAYLKRYHGLMEKQSVAFSLKMITSSDKLYPQSAAIDQEHDAVFVVFENGDSSSQILRKYKLSDRSFVSENDLKLPANSWIEGLSLTFNSDNEACFIINTNAELQQFKIYNYDQNTYSDVFTLIGSWKLNISDDHAYLITVSGLNVVNINDGITSINLYDFPSVMLAKPKLIKTIPVSNYDVHGGYKLQGLAMINEQIILGRGANGQAPRITVLDINGNVIEDYIFNSDNLLDLAQVKSSAPWSLENEGICYFVDAGITYPVAIDVYWDNSTTQLIFFKMGDVNDKIVEQEKIPLKDNSTTVSDLLVNPKGMSISVGKNNISILDVLVHLDRIGVFTISSDNGNSGNPLGATTLTGFATVKTVDSNRASRISVIAQDNNNVYYTNYYDVNANGWNGWQQLSGTVPYINPTSPVFDPLVQKTGSYLTKSSKNSPAFTNGAPDDVKLYDVKITSRGDKLIRCYNPTRNETFQAFIWTGTTDLVWQKVEQTIKA